MASLTTPEHKAEVRGVCRESPAVRPKSRDFPPKRRKTAFSPAPTLLNRVNGEKVPIWIADYVLASYGTGAVMAVPAHDERDFAFAKQYGIPIKVVISPPDWDGKPLDQAYIEAGKMVNSGPFDGTPSDEGLKAVTRYLEKKGWGRARSATGCATG